MLQMVAKLRSFKEPCSGVCQLPPERDFFGLATSFSRRICHYQADSFHEANQGNQHQTKQLTHRGLPGILCPVGLVFVGPSGGQLWAVPLRGWHETLVLGGGGEYSHKAGCRNLKTRERPGVQLPARSSLGQGEPGFRFMPRLKRVCLKENLPLCLPFSNRPRKRNDSKNKQTNEQTQPNPNQTDKQINT